MPRVPTANLQEGMIVVTDVKNVHDLLLIPAGCALTERQIGILQAWGIDEVEVQNSRAVEEADPLARVDPDVLAQLNQQIHERFWDTDNDPVFTELSRILLQRYARKMIPQQ